MHNLICYFSYYVSTNIMELIFGSLYGIIIYYAYFAHIKIIWLKWKLIMHTTLEYNMTYYDRTHITFINHNFCLRIYMFSLSIFYLPII